MTTAPPPHPAAAAAAALPPWHLAASLVSLKAAVDAHWPGRDKRSDGGIGDPRHQAEGSASDHNPWLDNTVRAYDFTVTQPALGIHGVDGAWLAEQLRLAGAAGDRRLVGVSGNVDDNGYVIYNRQITAPDFSRWVPYTGTDQHTSHVHVSVTRLQAGFEDGSPWAFLSSGAHPDPTPDPTGLPHVAAVPPTAAGHLVPVVGPHAGNAAHEAPAPVLDVDGPEGAGYPAPGQDAIGTGPSFRAQFGNRGPRVEDLQRALNKDLALYAQLEEDGIYGEETTAVIQDFARRVAADPALHDAELKAALNEANGDNVGPHLAAVFPVYGIHV